MDLSFVFSTQLLVLEVFFLHPIGIDPDINKEWRQHKPLKFILPQPTRTHLPKETSLSYLSKIKSHLARNSTAGMPCDWTWLNHPMSVARVRQGKTPNFIQFLGDPKEFQSNIICNFNFQVFSSLFASCLSSCTCRISKGQVQMPHRATWKD